jgi:hypothetical protein
LAGLFAVAVNIGDNRNPHYDFCTLDLPESSHGGGFLSLDVCLEDRIHACKVSFSIGFEPLHHIAVEAKMNGSLSPLA